MYAGRLVELGPSSEVLREPSHPYTRILSRAFPQTGDLEPRATPRPSLPGEPPDLRAELAELALVRAALPGGDRRVHDA